MQNKGVIHSSEKFVELRKIVNGYCDLIKAGVRLKNQISALFLSVHKDDKKEVDLESNVGNFVLKGLDLLIENYES